MCETDGLCFTSLSLEHGVYKYSYRYVTNCYQIQPSGRMLPSRRNDCRMFILRSRSEKRVFSRCVILLLRSTHSHSLSTTFLVCIVAAVVLPPPNFIRNVHCSRRGDAAFGMAVFWWNSGIRRFPEVRSIRSFAFRVGTFFWHRRKIPPSPDSDSGRCLIVKTTEGLF